MCNCKTFVVPIILLVNLYAVCAFADDYSAYYNCPENYFDAPFEKNTPNGPVLVTPPAGGLTMDEEFGEGTQAITRCIVKRNRAKVVVSINGAHPSDKNGNINLNKARFLSNIEYFRENYEDVHNMKIGQDVTVVAVAGSSGALLLTTEHPAWIRAKSSDIEPTCLGDETRFAGKTCVNPFKDLVVRAQEIGVEFYICQMASRTLGIKKPMLVPGVNFVPGAHLAVADFQQIGYALIDL